MIFAAWWNPLDWVKNGVGALFGVVSDAANGLLGDIFEWLSALLLRGVMWLFDVVYDFISQQTTPNLAEAWFQDGPLAIAQRVGAMLLMMLVILAIAETVWNRDGGAMLRSLGQDAPKALVLTLSLTFMSTIGLAVADGITAMFMSLFGTNIESFTETMSSITSKLSFGAGVLVIVLMALFLVIVLIFVALELVFRESFIMILVPLCAVMFATEVYRPTKGMGSRAGRLLITTIAAKPMIGLCLAVGATALGQQAAETSVNASEEPTADPEEINQNQLDTWAADELPNCVVGFAHNSSTITGDIPDNVVDSATGEVRGECERLLVAERCCNPLQWTGPAQLAADPWRPTVVVDPDGEDIDAVDTAAVAPTFGLVMSGLATMLLAAFSPFVLMRLISTDPGASTGEARGAAGGSAKTAVNATHSAGGRVSSMAKKAGG